MRRPLIGITCARGSGGTWRENTLGHFSEFVYDVYCQGVLSCGGVPLLVPTSQDGRTTIEICRALDGLVFTGGVDIHPRHYHQEPGVGLRDIDDARDRMELELARQAIRRDLPLLAICRGIQLINVALGGSLYQDIGLQTGSPILHSPAADRDVVTHTVKVAPDTVLQAIVKRKTLWVNSKHHQAIDKLASSLTASAWAQDGLIEAVEAPDHRFAVGVQWHPEGLWHKDAAAKNLFKALVKASANQ
ncbi:MAG: gamma-glutamyl-gamma-aminobutyrate hydrolase family protein [Desulfosarcinaceae bacterium]